MNKRVVSGIVAGGILFLGALGSSGQTQSSSVDNPSSRRTSSSEKGITEKLKPICDGTKVTSSCTLDNANYKTYIYHPAVPEKTHTETVTTYQEKITGYCTLCNDGTFSPSCATGRGACSWHGGVAQWNAPVSETIPVNSTKTVIDAPAQESYYEKVTE